MLLTAEKLIECDETEFHKHFTGKKFPELPAYKAKINWYGGEGILTAMLDYLAEKGFVSTKDIKIYGENVPGYSVNDMIKEHFKIEAPDKSSRKFIPKLEKLFPETTAYRCKTRLYYKARNKTSMNLVLEKYLP
jgi:hypothetical protein